MGLFIASYQAYMFDQKSGLGATAVSRYGAPHVKEAFIEKKMVLTLSQRASVYDTIYLLIATRRLSNNH